MANGTGHKIRVVTSVPRLPARKPDAHKGDYGRVFVLAGSRGMAGAACLCGKAVLRAGAGLVTVGVPEGIYPIVAGRLTCCMTHPLPENSIGAVRDRGREELRDVLADVDVLAVGPGLSKSAETGRLVNWLLGALPLPAVVDADGLNCVAKQTDVLGSRKGPTIVTPHPGEMCRLAGLKSAADVQKDRMGVAARFALEHRVIVVLKGHQTIVTDGSRAYVNRSGNPGMATAGAGDVLTGVVAGLLAQGQEPFWAAQQAVYIHGLAGDVAVRHKGEVSLMASDILNSLPAAFLSLAYPEQAPES